MELSWVVLGPLTGYIAILRIFDYLSKTSQTTKKSEVENEIK